MASRRGLKGYYEVHAADLPKKVAQWADLHNQWYEVCWKDVNERKTRPFKTSILGWGIGMTAALLVGLSDKEKMRRACSSLGVELVFISCQEQAGLISEVDPNKVDKKGRGAVLHPFEAGALLAFHVDLSRRPTLASALAEAADRAMAAVQGGGRARLLPARLILLREEPLSMLEALSQLGRPPEVGRQSRYPTDGDKRSFCLFSALTLV